MSNYGYFFYSKQYDEDRNAVENAIGKVFIPGTVVVDGVKKEYNILSDTNEVNRYSDARYVTEGDLSTIKYTPGKTQYRRI